MRTTLSIDDDLYRKLREFMKQTDKGLKEAINELLAQGLESKVRPANRTKKATYKPHQIGFYPGIDSGKLNQLADELDTEEFLSRHRE